MRIKVNGTTLFFDVEGAKLVPDGMAMRERPTVVLLHGGPGFDHSTFKPDFSCLAEVAQIVYLDHRGNGRSDRDDPTTWRLDQWADDVRAFCEALEIEKPVVLGWSFGGFVAQAYAARHSDHPRGLVLQSTAARMDVARVTEAFRKIAGDEVAEAAHAFWTAPSPETMAAYAQLCLPAYSPGDVDAEAMARCVQNPELMMGFLQDEMEMDLRAGLGHVCCPTLVLAGELDPITPIESADEIVSALPPQHVRFVRFPKSGHFIPMTEPERFFSTLVEFVTAA